MKSFCAAVAILTCATGAHGASPEPLSPPDIAKRAFESCVLLTMQDNQGQPLCMGSGFFTDANTVVTNFHVVDQAGSGYAKLVGQSSKIHIKGIVGLDPLHDLALLEVASSAPALTLATNRSVNVGDAVYVIGNPEGLEGTFSPGVVSGFREIGAVRILQMTAPISPGSSGGPVLDQSGSVIGVAAATLREGQNLNFAVPSEYVVALQTHRTELRSFKAIPSIERRNTLLGQIGGNQPRTGVVGENFEWGAGECFNVYCGKFSFSLHNKLGSDVAKIRGFVIFYNTEGEPLDTCPIGFEDIIPAHSARRLSGSVDESVQRLSESTWCWDNVSHVWRKCPDTGDLDADRKMAKRITKIETRHGKVEFRILDFTVE